MAPPREGNRDRSAARRVSIRLLIPDKGNAQRAVTRAIASAGGSIERIRLILRGRGTRKVEIVLSVVHELLMKSIHEVLGQIPGVALAGTFDLEAREGGAKAPSRSDRSRRKIGPAPVTQKDIARRLGLHVTSVSKILNRRLGPGCHGERVRQVFELAHRLGYSFERLKHEHRRRHPRKIVDLPVEISIYVAGNTVYDRGMAVLRDVSLSGALLHTLVLPGMKLPVGPFTVGIRVLQGPLQEMEVRGRPVRFTFPGEALGLAMEFIDAEAIKARRLCTGLR